MNGKIVKVYSLKADGGNTLSTNFRVREFRSRDGADVICVDPELVTVLQLIRNHFGRPVTINSGYRTHAHNKAVGGAAQSRHLYGMAADIVVSGTKPGEVAAYADKLMPNSGGIGIYSWGVHVDTRAEKSRWNG